ncbi:hypothetical protein C4B63_53g143 [Trypanosoma cruzi]|uniref:Uncharacterized protein n=1 Tax=Trypanosoma cruzi TaxID=5693 RepID=A0A2V2V0W4_TRYCR|nr:hypothetical protein C4B63_53g143 [Trypanosoma cruzi]
MCARDVGTRWRRTPQLQVSLARRSELLKDPVGNADTIADVDNILHRRGLEVEAARKRRGKPLQPDGLFAFDDVDPTTGKSLTTGHVASVRGMQDSCMRASFRRARRVRSSMKMRSCHRSRYLRPLLSKATRTSRNLAVLRDALVVEGREVNAPAIQCVEEQMRRRMQQLRSDERKAAKAEARREQWLLEQHPYLDGVALAGLPLSKLGLSGTRSLRGWRRSTRCSQRHRRRRRGSGGEGAVFEGACRAAGCCSSEAGGCAARADAVPDASSI